MFSTEIYWNSFLWVKDIVGGEKTDKIAFFPFMFNKIEFLEEYSVTCNEQHNSWCCAWNVTSVELENKRIFWKVSVGSKNETRKSSGEIWYLMNY